MPKPSNSRAYDAYQSLCQGCQGWALVPSKRIDRMDRIHRCPNPRIVGLTMLIKVHVKGVRVGPLCPAKEWTEWTEYTDAQTLE